VTDRSDFPGYRDPALAVLQEHGVRVWSDVVIETHDGRFAGLILPRAETENADHIVLKVENGYNIGVNVDRIVRIREIGYRRSEYRIREHVPPHDQAKPNVTLIGTGGTIASRLDYRTGAVIPAVSAGELYSIVPELADYVNLTTRQVYAIFSENVTPEHWLGTATAIAEEIRAGADGIVVGHGTDTMGHTAAALTFMLQDSPVPIVMVGSQRSADRPSSDAALNLTLAAYAAGHGDIAEVLVCMFGPTSDQYNLLHRGTRVRKMHSSYRSTFRTISDIPLATVRAGEIRILKREYRHRDRNRQLKLDAVFDDRVTILYHYPDMKPDIVEALVDNGYKGIVIAGTGLGHVNRSLHPVLKRAVQSGVHVYMTAATIWGFVHMYVYDSGRELIELGVVPAGNMIPYTAYVKLGWALGHTHDREKVQQLMLTPVCDELTEREPIDGYLVMQGGLPETEQFIAHHRR
jgi:glutamyl-tRNA(Gln) amidotransferase subunit D